MKTTAALSKLNLRQDEMISDQVGLINRSLSNLEAHAAVSGYREVAEWCSIVTDEVRKLRVIARRCVAVRSPKRPVSKKTF